MKEGCSLPPYESTEYTKGSNDLLKSHLNQPPEP